MTTGGKVAPLVLFEASNIPWGTSGTLIMKILATVIFKISPTTTPGISISTEMFLLLLDIILLNLIFDSIPATHFLCPSSPSATHFMILKK